MDLQLKTTSAVYVDLEQNGMVCLFRNRAGLYSDLLGLHPNVRRCVHRLNETDRLTIQSPGAF